MCSLAGSEARLFLSHFVLNVVLNPGQDQLQSINQHSICRAPLYNTVQEHTIKKYTLESFSESTGVSNVLKVGRKSVPGAGPE